MFVSVCIVKLSVRLSFIAQCVCVRSMIKMMYVCIYGYMFTYVHMDTCVRLIRLLGRVQLRSTMMPSMAVISWVRLPWQQQSGDAAASAAVTALPGALGALRLIKKNKKNLHQGRPQHAAVHPGRDPAAASFSCNDVMCCTRVLYGTNGSILGDDDDNEMVCSLKKMLVFQKG